MNHQELLSVPSPPEWMFGTCNIWRYPAPSTVSHHGGQLRATRSALVLQA
jgi:hypothetical protein